MTRAALKTVAVVTVMIIYGAIYFMTYLEGTKNKNIARHNVDIMAKSAIDVHKRMTYVIDKIELRPDQAEQALRVMAVLQDDFTFSADYEYNGDYSYIEYPVKIGDDTKYLVVGFRYFMENTALTHKEMSHLSDYTIRVINKGYPLNRESLRRLLDIDDASYLYYKPLINLEEGSTLVLIGHIAKPSMYSIIYPNSMEDYFRVVLLITGMFYVVYSLLLNLVSYIESSKRMSRLIHTDDLTGLGNRRVLDMHEWHDGDVLIMVDLDGFKTINDTHGHVAGDKLICEFAKSLELSTRERDKVIRIGGDEFILILSSADLETVTQVIERVKLYSTVEFSYGFAIFSKGVSPSDMLKEADKMMYENKK